jgi:hypothetical protein
MLLTACHDAECVPTPQNPPIAAWELDADEYCLRFARTMNPERMSPEAAAALIPRLEAVKIFLDSLNEPECLWGARSDQAILEELLVWLWYRRLKAHWLVGRHEACSFMTALNLNSSRSIVPLENSLSDRGRAF